MILAYITIYLLTGAVSLLGLTLLAQFKMANNLWFRVISGGTGISFTDQFGTREYSVISMSGFYANCGSLTTNPTSYYHGLPNEGSDGFLYYSVNSHILQLKEENQFSTNIITISEEGISFTQELKGSANLDSSSPIYNGEWVLESNVATIRECCD